MTHSRRTSRDAACTMVIGKDVALGPTAVKASNVTATSAVISWMPSNSNHQHVVCVNNVEVRTVKPGVYRHTIIGLAPSTIYRVTVKAKNLRATHFEDQNTQAANNLACHVHFKTLPKGLPDPPVDIQVNSCSNIYFRCVTFARRTRSNLMVSMTGGGWTAGRHFASDLAACCPKRFGRHRLRGVRRWEESDRRRQPHWRPRSSGHTQTYGFESETHHGQDKKQGESIRR